MFVGILRDMTAQLAADDKRRATELELQTVAKSMVEQRRLLKDAEERVFQNRQRFEAIVENNPSAISVRDFSNRFTLVNKALPVVREEVGRGRDRSNRERNPTP